MLKDYSRLRREFLDQNPICQDCGKRRSSEIHHKAGRHGRMLLDVEHWGAICRKCHDRIHSAPAQARSRRWLYDKSSR